MEAGNDKYRLLAENLPYALAYHQVVIDVNGSPVDYIFLDVNVAFEEMTGLTGEKVLGKKISELHPDIKDFAFDWTGTYNKVALTGESIRFEQYIEPADCWYEITACSGGHGYLTTIFRDITEQKQDRAKLGGEKNNPATLSSFHKKMLDTAIVWINTLDTEGNITYFNRAAELISGYTAEEVTGHAKIWEWLYPDPEYREYLFKSTLQVIHKGEKDENFETQIRRKDGAFRTIMWNSNKIVAGGRIIGSIAIGIDITERKQAEEKMQYMSYHDNLTGLYNRGYLEEEMNRLDTERQLPISIIMADLNGLKLINDTCGHAKGDEMLKATANILKSSSRAEDIVARWGGDEFMLFLPQSTAEDADTICNRIKSRCSKTFVDNMLISLSLGVSSKNHKQESLFSVIKEADDDMYRQKFTERQSTKNTFINILLTTMRKKSYETEEHNMIMQEVAQEIGTIMDLSASELNRLDFLVILHDIGKINIMEEILTKKNALAAEEWEEIKKHPEIGYRIARGVDFFAHVADDILAHHEHWDGSGYPQGLKGKEISLLARITAIADAYEIMKNGRPHKKAMNRIEIVAEFKRCAGTQFDPKLVEIFLKVLENREL